MTRSGPYRWTRHPLYAGSAVIGLGVAIAPYATVHQDLESGVLVAPFGFFQNRSSYCLLTRSDNAGDPRN